MIQPWVFLKRSPQQQQEQEQQEQPHA